jgi:uncharacterized protein (DUF1778 family)
MVRAGTWHATKIPAIDAAYPRAFVATAGLSEAECKQRPKETPSAVTLVKHVVLPYINLRRMTMPSTRKKKLASPKREYKTQRLELRLAPSAKKVIQQAISVTGLAAGDLAYEGARRLLDEHQRMVLSGADRDAFLAAIGRTRDPSPRLVEALKRHRHLFG